MRYTPHPRFQYFKSQPLNGLSPFQSEMETIQIHGTRLQKCQVSSKQKLHF